MADSCLENNCMHFYFGNINVKDVRHKKKIKFDLSKLSIRFSILIWWIDCSNRIIVYCELNEEFRIHIDFFLKPVIVQRIAT